MKIRDRSASNWHLGGILVICRSCAHLIVDYLAPSSVANEPSSGLLAPTLGNGRQNRALLLQPPLPICQNSLQHVRTAVKRSNGRFANGLHPKQEGKSWLDGNIKLVGNTVAEYFVTGGLSSAEQSVGYSPQAWRQGIISSLLVANPGLDQCALATVLGPMNLTLRLRSRSLHPQGLASASWDSTWQRSSR